MVPKILLAFPLLLSPLGATTVVLAPDSFGEVNLGLDFDGDSVEDLRTFGGGIVTVTIDSMATFPNGSVLAYESFADPQALGNWVGYSGLVTVAPGTRSNETVGFFSAQPDLVSSPILAGWQLGTSGTLNTDPYRILGFVIDARDYALDDSLPITLYYHDYGSVFQGQSVSVSLESTGFVVPEPSSMVLFLGTLALAGRRRR